MNHSADESMKIENFSRILDEAIARSKEKDDDGNPASVQSAVRYQSPLSIAEQTRRQIAYIRDFYRLR